MGQPFQMSYVDRVVGSCELCGLEMKQDGINTGRVTTIGYDCAEKIARIVHERAAGIGLVPMPASVADEQAASEANVARVRRSRQSAAAVA